MSNKNETKNLKTEIANELGIDLKKDNITAKEAGQVGGEMTKRLVEEGKKNAK